MPAPPLTYRLLNQLLGGDLSDQITARKSAGESYDSIAFDISTRVGEVISGENLRRWHARVLEDTETEGAA